MKNTKLLFFLNFDALMKTKLILAFLLLAIFPCGAQSLMEKRTAKLINDYRQSRGLKTLVIDTGLTRASRFHAQFEAFFDTVTHIEFDSFKGSYMNNPGHRIKFFTKNTNPAYGNEITAGGSRYIDSIFIRRVRLEDYLINIEQRIVEGFKNSPHHHEALVSRKPTKMGLCIMTDRKAVGKGVKIRYFCVITFMAD